jgi:hypothetical protein
MIINRSIKISLNLLFFLSLVPLLAIENKNEFEILNHFSKTYTLQHFNYRRIVSQTVSLTDKPAAPTVEFVETLLRQSRQSKPLTEIAIEINVARDSFIILDELTSKLAQRPRSGSLKSVISKHSPLRSLSDALDAISVSEALPLLLLFDKSAVERSYVFRDIGSFFNEQGSFRMFEANIFGKNQIWILNAKSGLLECVLQWWPSSIEAFNEGFFRQMEQQMLANSSSDDEVKIAIAEAKKDKKYLDMIRDLWETNQKFERKTVTAILFSYSDKLAN